MASLKNKTILITGGAGAIGTNLVSALLPIASKIIVVDDLSSGHQEFVGKNKKVVFIKKSINDDRLYHQLAKHPIEVVFHLAAHFANQNSVEHPLKDLEVNGTGTLKLLEYAVASKIKKFIYASSSCVYGNAEGSVKENAPFHLDTPYAITKLLGESYAKFFHEYHGLSTVILRLFNSFGPGELAGKYRNVIPNFLDAAIKGKPLTITGTGKETRDFNWVGNVVHAFIASAEKDKAEGETFNIGSGKETAITELANLIKEITGSKSQVVYTERRSWDHVLRRKADITKAQKILGYKPEINLAKHLKATYDWYRKQKHPLRQAE